MKNGKMSKSQNPFENKNIVWLISLFVEKMFANDNYHERLTSDFSWQIYWPNFADFFKVTFLGMAIKYMKSYLAEEISV